MSTENENNEMIGVRVEPSLRARIAAAAKADGRPVSNWARNVLSQYLEAMNDGQRAA
jgi:hypothetical protein